MSWSFLWLVLTVISCSVVNGIENFATDSLDASLQDFAFKTLVVRRRPRTGAIYRAVLPANLSSIDVSIVRLRSRRLWNMGANFSFFRIPSRTMPLPHVKRVAIVYQNLGNWSSNYYGIQGYSLITPVVGFMVFDASNASAKSIRKLSFSTTDKPISIHFPSLALRQSPRSDDTRCITFSDNGTVYLTQMNLPGVCYSRDQGRFAIVIPQKSKRRFWYLWVVGSVLGVSGTIAVGYVGMVSARILKTKKIQVTERQAQDDSILESRWVGGSKMPSATAIRTQPVLENGGVH